MSEATTYGSVSGLEPYAIWRGATARAVHGEAPRHPRLVPRPLFGFAAGMGFLWYSVKFCIDSSAFAAPVRAGAF